MHGAAGERKGLQMHGGLARGSWGQQKAVCCFASISAVGMVPSICSRAHCTALRVLFQGCLHVAYCGGVQGHRKT